MISFLISVFALIIGYWIYGGLMAKKICPADPHAVTPAIAKADGMDYVAMPAWKIYMIQFLNIAGTGPIFGAIMGAKFGPSCYLWIVFGCIFAGAVHDFLSGMISLKNGGVGLPDIIGQYLGNTVKIGMLWFTVLLMVLVGAVFVYSPALILGDIAGFLGTKTASVFAWAGLIFIYYIIATLLPIDKIIGRVYPLFAFALIFMALALFVCLLGRWPSLPEFWQGLGNRGPEIGQLGQSIFPCLFITVACGAISGFHATQSPLMARCMTSQKQGRPIFYGAMITEGIVGLIWAAIGSYFFFDGGMAEVGATSGQAPVVVTSVAKSWIGLVGGILAILGVVAAPITSGDTALRSARLILADFLHLDQMKKANRLAICVPMFALVALVLWFNVADEDGFNTIWRYFGWANQSLACFTLWALTAWLGRRKSLVYLVTLIPACFMTSVCLTYICVNKIGFNMPDAWIPYIAVLTAVVSAVLFYVLRNKKHLTQLDPEAWS